VTQRGRYRSGLAGAPAAAAGRVSSLRCAGCARVEGGETTDVRVITDCIGLRREIAK
jgi:hypothetical protein